MSALLRIAQALVGLALLIGAMLLALVLTAGLVLRAAIKGRRPLATARGPGAKAHGARWAPPSSGRWQAMEVVDVEAREVPTPTPHGR